MKQRIELRTLLSQTSEGGQQTASFALLCLGIIESLTSGTISSSAAVELFFHADNCLFVQRELRQKTADEIMSHGVQLPDIFDTLPVGEAQRQFQHELAIMHSLCLTLLEKDQVAA